MSIQIDRKQLYNFLQSNDVLDFEKDRIQESTRRFLKERCTQRELKYLKDLQIIKEDNKDNIENCEEKELKFNRERRNGIIVMKSLWDYQGIVNNSHFFGTQKDWNKTILDRIDGISSRIKERNNCRADFVLIREEIRTIIEDNDYFYPLNNNQQSDCLFNYIGDLKNKYDIFEIDDPNFMGMDEVIVGQRDKNNEVIYYGIINIENLNEQ